MTDTIHTLCVQAADLVKSTPPSTRIRVVSHYDADGITAAGIICKAVSRLGYDFHATLMRNPFTRGFERLKAEENELIIFSDMGSAQLDMIEALECSAIILDHHQYIKKTSQKGIIQINANTCGIDGNYEACGASLSYAFAQALDETNHDLIVLALAGVIGDKQHIGGIKGFNRTLLESAIKQGLVRERTCIKLYGPTISDALYATTDPYYSGISGNKEAIEKLLQNLDIAADALISDLSSESLIRLQSYLFFTLIKRGVPRNILDTVIRKRYWSDMLGCELERFADLLDACGKGGYRGLGLSVCLGDGEAFGEAEHIEQKYKQQILDALSSLENDGIIEKDGFRFFYSDDSSLGGVICGIAANYITDLKKPLFSIGRKKDEIHISSRGNQWLVSQGLDLGGALKTVTGEIGGHGGGHKIAAGATINRKDEPQFIEKIDKILTQQLKGAK